MESLIKERCSKYLELNAVLYVRSKISLDKPLTVNIDKINLNNNNSLYNLLDISEVWKKNNGINTLSSMIELTNQITDISFIPIDDIVIHNFSTPLELEFLGNPAFNGLSFSKFNQFIRESLTLFNISKINSSTFIRINKKQNDINLQKNLTGIDKKYFINFWENFYSGEIFDIDEYINTFVDSTKLHVNTITYEDYSALNSDKLYMLSLGGGFIIRSKDLHTYI